VGGGCAFLDLRQRRLDGTSNLVNSGPCDFFNPKTPLRNALYHNNRDGTFTNVTARAGVGGDAYGMGVAVVITTPMALPISLSRNIPQRSVSQ